MLKRLLLAVAASGCVVLPALAAGTLTVGVTALPAAMGNPYMGAAMPATLPWAAIFDAVTRIDERGRAEPALAVDWQPVDTTTWEFKLRPDVTFQNGEPFNADAIVAAVRHINSGSGQRTAMGAALRMVKRAEKRDNLTVVLKTDVPTPILPLLMRQFRVPAPGAWAKLDADEFALKPVGTGPFAVESWTNAEIVAKAYMKSWRPPKLDALTIKVVPEDAMRLASLIAGQLDVAMWLTPDDQSPVSAGGGQLVPRREPSLQMISFATAKRSPLQDPRVRTALNLAVDRKRIIEAALAKGTEPATQYALPSYFGFDPAMEAFPYDPAKARVMLSDAGYYRGFTMVVAIPPGQSQAVYQEIANDLAAVNVKVELRPLSMAQYAQHLSEGSWPGAAFANAQTMADPVETMKGTLCAIKASFHCPIEISRLVDKARGEFDVAARMAAVQEIHRLQRIDPPGLLLWQGVAFDGVAGSVGGWKVVQDVIKFEDIEKK